jgi:phage FluMu gp28-like protein
MGLFTPEERLNYADSFIKVDQKPIDLDFWQQDHIRDTNKYSIVLKSRRTGFSFDVALKGIIKANDKARFKYTRQFVSYNEDDAKEKITYAKEFYHSIPAKYRKKLVSETKTTMEFYDKGEKTTSRLISIACRPPRGRGGDIVFDEMAIYPPNRTRIIYTAGLPVISRGGCIEIGSTPLGKIGMFYDIYTNEKDYPHFTRYEVPWWVSTALCKDVTEAVKYAPDMDTEERVDRFAKEDTIKPIFDSMFLEDFQQEYECSFIDAALSFITLDLIYANTPGMREGERGDVLQEAEGESLEHDGIEVKVFHDTDSFILGYSLERHGKLYLGYDVARRRDAAVIFGIGHRKDGKKISVADIEMKNQTFEYQLDQIRKILKSGLPVVRVCIDQTGQGEPLCEKLQSEFGHTMIEGVLFNQESKEVLAIGVRTGLEKLEFLLQNDRKFQGQIHSIKRTATVGGHFRYDSERDENGHADSFWAWALAHYAITQQIVASRPGFYQQLKARKEAYTGAGEGTTLRKRGKSYEAVIRSMDRGSGYGRI